MRPATLCRAAVLAGLAFSLAGLAAPVRADAPPGPVGPAAVGLTALRPPPAALDAPALAAPLTSPGVLIGEAVALIARDSTLRLPRNLPPYTRLLWGERGLVRVLGLAPARRRDELKLRRSMLGLHQKMGLLTWGVFTAQVVTGQLLISRPESYDRLQSIHRPLGYTTFGLYLGTASLSLGAPPARRYDTHLSSVRVHRYLAIVHFAGMMAQPWLGRWVANGGADYNRRRSIHQAVGYTTYAAYTAAMGTVLFSQ